MWVPPEVKDPVLLHAPTRAAGVRGVIPEKQWYPSQVAVGPPQGDGALSGG